MHILIICIFSQITLPGAAWHAARQWPTPSAPTMHNLKQRRAGRDRPRCPGWAGQLVRRRGGHALDLRQARSDWDSFRPSSLTSFVHRCLGIQARQDLTKLTLDLRHARRVTPEPVPARGSHDRRARLAERLAETGAARADDEILVYRKLGWFCFHMSCVRVCDP